MRDYQAPGLVRRLVAPALFLVSVPVLLHYLTPNIDQADAMARGLAGPISWPRFALYGVFFCAAGWLVQSIIQNRRGHAEHSAADLANAVGPDDPAAPPSNEVVIWIGIVLTLLYGFLIPVVGYPLATAGYIVLWLLLGGIRRPVLISAVTVLGTVLLLYVFVKLALMPLDRGQGVFGDLTVAIYRLLHIY